MNTAHFDVRTLSPGDLFYVGTGAEHIAAARQYLRETMRAEYDAQRAANA